MGQTLKEALNVANPNNYPQCGKLVRMGDIASGTRLVGTLPVVSDVAVLPETARAAALLAVYSAAGTLTGQLDVLKAGETPATGDVSINAVGNVVFAGADAVTSAEIAYIAVDGPVISEPVALNGSAAGSFGKGRSGVLILEATVDGAARTVIARKGTPGVGQIALTAAGQLQLNAADASKTVVVKYVAMPGVGQGVQDDVISRLTDDQNLV